MAEHEFTLTFALSATEVGSDECVERLGAGGCDDAIVGVGKPGRIALSFNRDRASATEAVFSAVSDVRRAMPEAALIEAAPDLVGITEAARLVGRTRQNMRKLLLSCGSLAPAPVHEGTASIWHLAQLLDWLKAQKGYDIPDEMVELAQTNMQLNIVAAERGLAPTTRTQIARLLA